LARRLLAIALADGVLVIRIGDATETEIETERATPGPS
jgi:hypothetical protein